MPYLRVCALSLLATLAASQASAQAAEALDLAGIRKIQVVIETIDDDARRAGLSEDRMRTIVELKLRREGLRVLTTAQVDLEPLIIPWLYLNVSVMPWNDGNQFVFAVDLTAYVSGVPSPINRASILGELWERNNLGAAGVQRMPKSAEDMIEEAVDAFLNAWLEANPKR